MHFSIQKLTAQIKNKVFIIENQALLVYCILSQLKRNIPWKLWVLENKTTGKFFLAGKYGVCRNCRIEQE